MQIDPANFAAPRLKAVLEDPTVLKIFHFARFDVAVLKQYLGADTAPLYCTKIASKIARTYTDRHGLKDILKELLGIEANKQQQSSDWGSHVLSDAQKTYAAQDVLYLHELKSRLDQMLERDGRMVLANARFGFIPARAARPLVVGVKKMSSRTEELYASPPRRARAAPTPGPG